mmetsp:Transcript_19262/g.73747  ORF Transcript_19262/g.73747 Transcript_19262/m.73747 type:complete len:285 (-) Transcript_19262:1863-2717(-)
MVAGPRPRRESDAVVLSGHWRDVQSRGSDGGADSGAHPSSSLLGSPMTLPTAMVRPSSRRVKRPSCWRSSYFSRHVRRVRERTAVQRSPSRTNLTRPLTSPVFLFSSAMILSQLTSSSAVWTCMMALYPAVKMPLWSRLESISWAWNLVTACTGAWGSQSTYPFMTSSSVTPLRRTRTFSPGLATEISVSSSRKILSTRQRSRRGMTMMRWPSKRMPASTLPMAMVPRSLKRSRMGMRRALYGSRPGIFTSSKAWSSVGPLNQSATPAASGSFTLAPVRPLMGM